HAIAAPDPLHEIGDEVATSHLFLIDFHLVTPLVQLLAKALGYLFSLASLSGGVLTPGIRNEYLIGRLIVDHRRRGKDQLLDPSATFIRIWGGPLLALRRSCHLWSLPN